MGAVVASAFEAIPSVETGEAPPSSDERIGLSEGGGQEEGASLGRAGVEAGGGIVGLLGRCRVSSLLGCRCSCFLLRMAAKLCGGGELDEE